MRNINYLKDNSFLEDLTKEKLKTVYTKIIILDKQELPVTTVQGKVVNGSINIEGNAAVRRTGSMTFVADETITDVTNIDNIISINKKVNIFIGIENNINDKYDKIIWFPLGIFVITQPSISHSLNGINISLSFKDKMALLNGECGGGLPTSVTFHEYDQVIGYLEVDELPEDMNDYTIYGLKKSNGSYEYFQWDDSKGWVEGDPSQAGEIISRPQRIFDIIRTLVINYGGENPAKVFINDVPLEIKSSVRYVGSDSVYYNPNNSKYTLNQEEILDDFEDVKEFKYNEDIGYIYTDFTYPGELISGIGDNVVSVLERIKTALGNYEYFYDIEGNFIFQEIKNYLNTSYDVTNLVANNSILNNSNYQVGFNNVSKSVYTFEEGSALISSFSNSPSYLNIKNDFHIWGENDDGYVIHYHLVIKEKPIIMNEYEVVFNENGGLRLASDYEIKFGQSRVYVPEDWRAELYLQGLRKRELGQRPDIYEQELLDMFDSIYNFKEKAYKSDIIQRPNSLSYYIDYLEPTEKLHDFSVDVLGTRKYSYQKDKINKLYNADIPNNILINVADSAITRAEIIARCDSEGQPYANVSSNVYENVAIGTSGYTAHETARELLYQYTDYNESISIQSIPIYYLDTNSRISVYDKASNIFGDYIIKSISLPLDAKSTMSISATRALERI